MKDILVQTRSSHERLIMQICQEHNCLCTRVPLTCGLMASRMTQMRTVLLTSGLCVPAWRYWGKTQKASWRIVGLRPYTDNSKVSAFYKAYDWWWSCSATHTHTYVRIYRPVTSLTCGGGDEYRLSHVWSSSITHILHLTYHTNILYIYTHTHTHMTKNVINSSSELLQASLWPQGHCKSLRSVMTKQMTTAHSYGSLSQWRVLLMFNSQPVWWTLCLSLRYWSMAVYYLKTSPRSLESFVSPLL